MFELFFQRGFLFTDKDSFIEMNAGQGDVFIDKKSGRQFRLFKYFDHEVIQDVETGWINAGQFVLNLHRSGFTKQYLNNFKSTSDYNVALELGKRMILQRNDSTGFPVESSHPKDVENFIFRNYKKDYGVRVQGTFTPFKVFQLIALWADKKHKLAILDLLEQINTHANLIHKSAYDVLNNINDQLKEEIARLK